MTGFLVSWEIDIEADTPREAAELALEIMRRPDSSATIFQIHSEHGGFAQVDLLSDDTEVLVYSDRNPA